MSRAHILRIQHSKLVTIPPQTSLLSVALQTHYCCQVDIASLILSIRATFIHSPTLSVNLSSTGCHWYRNTVLMVSSHTGCSLEINNFLKLKLTHFLTHSQTTLLSLEPASVTMSPHFLWPPDLAKSLLGSPVPFSTLKIIK